MNIQDILSYLLDFIGILTLAYYLSFFVENLIFYLKHKKFKLSFEEEKIKLLEKEIENLNTQLSNSEAENKQITTSILQRL
jgi:hypothetical protein